MAVMAVKQYQKFSDIVASYETKNSDSFTQKIAERLLVKEKVLLIYADSDAFSLRPRYIDAIGSYLGFDLDERSQIPTNALPQLMPFLVDLTICKASEPKHLDLDAFISQSESFNFDTVVLRLDNESFGDNSLSLTDWGIKVDSLINHFNDNGIKLLISIGFSYGQLGHKR